MATRALHHRFMKLDGTHESFIKFATRYGLLGRHAAILCVVDDRSGVQEQDRLYYGESVLFWTHTLHKVRTLHDLAELIRSGAGPGEFSELCEKNFREVEQLGWRIGFLLRLSKDDERPSTKENVVSLAGHHLRKELNRELVAGCAAVIGADGRSLSLAPRDLAGAIYAHFALEVAGLSKPPRQCAHCGVWFIPQDERQLYCEKRCLYKAYRKNRKQKEKANA